MDLTYKEIKNLKKWDKLIETLPNYSFLISSARLKTLEYKTQKLAIYKKEKFIGVCPVQIRKSRFNKYLFCQHSPSFKNFNIDYLMDLIAQLKKIALKEKCTFIRICPLIKNSDSNRKIVKTHTKGHFAPIHNIDGLATQIIDTNKSKKKILKDMRSSSRRKIRKLKDNQYVSLQTINNLSQFDTFAKLHNKTCKLKGYSTKTINKIRREYQSYVDNNMFYSILGGYKDKIINIWNLVRYRDTLLYYHGASDIEYREKNLNMSYIVFWEAILLAKKLKCNRLDLFGGIVPKRVDKENHPWKGISFFKKGLGGYSVEYIHPIDIPIKKLKYHVIEYPYSLIKAKKNNYPINW